MFCKLLLLLLQRDNILHILMVVYVIVNYYYTIIFTTDYQLLETGRLERKDIQDADLFFLTICMAIVHNRQGQFLFSHNQNCGFNRLITLLNYSGNSFVHNYFYVNFKVKYTHFKSNYLKIRGFSFVTQIIEKTLMADYKQYYLCTSIREHKPINALQLYGHNS